MKTKSSNKVNILLIAITLLLLFVMGINSVGKTNSWLINQDTIGFIEVQVGKINLIIKQGETVIEDGGYIALGTDLIQPDTTYLTNTLQSVDGKTTGEDNSVVILNDEKGEGYYIRFQVIAMLNGVAYNINSCIKGSDFYNRQITDEGWWMYSVDDNTATKPVNTAIASKETLVMLKDIEFPQSFIDIVQGQYFKMYLYIEGSADGSFV